MFPYSSSTTVEGGYSFPLFQFPCPLMDDVEEGLMGLSQESHNPVYHEEMRRSSNNNNGEREGGLVYKKRKKMDRHSKICTAQGVRDRRMRLSVKVARRFFDLQDMLDFDKASKTIEWLLINSEPAIQQLTSKTNTNQSMSISSTEVVSVSNNKEIEDKKKKGRVPIAKESRDKARARARDRTRDKIKLTHLKLNFNKDSAICGANEFPTNNGATMTSKKPSLGNGPNAQEHSSIFMALSNGGPWNPSSLFWNAQDLHNPIIHNSIFMNPNALELGIPSPLFTNSIIGTTHFL